MKIESLKKLGATVLTTTVLTISLFTNTTQAAEEKYNLNNRVNIYMSADDAKYNRNRVGSYSAGKYYVYAEYNGYINITKTEGVPGAWIKKEAKSTSSSRNTTTRPSRNISTSSSDVKVSGNKVNISKSVKVYMNSADAKAGRNSVKSYSAGSYFIYKEADGALNISKTAGRAGGWIYEKVTKEETVEETPQVEEVQEEVVVEEKNESPVVVNSNTVELNTNVSGFMNVDNAKSGRNAVTTYSAGTYYIYKTYNGMVNISSVRNQAGAWINPGDAKVVEEVREERSSSSSSNSSALADRIVDEARSLVGLDYVFASQNRSVGFDCSGLTSYVFRNIAGISLPHSASRQSRMGEWVSLDNLQKGDLLFFGDPGDIYHVGVYVGNNRVVHALNEDSGVVEQTLTGWNARKLQFARRLVD